MGIDKSEGILPNVHLLLEELTFSAHVHILEGDYGNKQFSPLQQHVEEAHRLSAVM